MTRLPNLRWSSRSSRGRRRIRASRHRARPRARRPGGRQIAWSVLAAGPCHGSSSFDDDGENVPEHAIGNDDKCRKEQKTVQQERQQRTGQRSPTGFVLLLAHARRAPHYYSCRTSRAPCYSQFVRDVRSYWEARSRQSVRGRTGQRARSRCVTVTTAFAALKRLPARDQVKDDRCLAPKLFLDNARGANHKDSLSVSAHNHAGNNDVSRRRSP